MNCKQIVRAHCAQMEDLFEQIFDKVDSPDVGRLPGYLDRTLCLGRIGAVQRIC
jgi:hypothetical protein